MENKEYEIKVDGTPNTFEGGAVRYNKSKGRFDLIPMNVLYELLSILPNEYSEANINSQYDIYRKLCSTSRDRFLRIIYAIMVIKYDSIIKTALPEMMLDLAIHFQKGAEKYGEHNCEKGIPLWSFIDSGTRHCMQFLAGRTDEPHYISAIWNFWMAEWTCLKFEEENGIKLKEVKNDCNFDEMLPKHSDSDNDEGGTSECSVFHS